MEFNIRTTDDRFLKCIGDEDVNKHFMDHNN